MDDKFISFPLDRIVRRPNPTLAEQELDLAIRTKLMRTLHVQEVVEVLMPLLFSQLAIGGFDLSGEDDLKDAAFITEAIRSVLCKQKGIDHPFQQLADSLFVDEEDGLSIVDQLNLNFKNELSDNRSTADHDSEPDGPPEQGAVS